MGPALSATARPGQTPAVLVYDAECPMCRASAMWLMRLALAGGKLEILPCRSPVRARRFPALSEETCLSAMQLVLPDGRVLAGADAVPELLRRIRGLGWIAALFALPALRPLARRVYAWIARHRLRISCAFPSSTPPAAG